jgi:hypothetical protein
VRVQYHLIPDGISTIVKVTVEEEWVVATSDAARAAEDGVVQLVARIAGCPESEVRAQMTETFWIGEGWRPAEEDDGGR